MKVFAALVVSFQLADAAFFALTMHVAAAVAFNEVPLTEHAVPVTVKVTAPVPDPPDVVSAIAVPTVPVSVVFDTDSVDCFDSPMPRITGELLSVAPPPQDERTTAPHEMTARASPDLHRFAAVDCLACCFIRCVPFASERPDINSPGCLYMPVMHAEYRVNTVFREGSRSGLGLMRENRRSIAAGAVMCGGRAALGVVGPPGVPVG